MRKLNRMDWILFHGDGWIRKFIRKINLKSNNYVVVLTGIREKRYADLRNAAERTSS